MTNQEYIDAALNRDTELGTEEYRAKCKAADRSPAAHDIAGKAPISEAVRHKRIQTNFYGTALNVMLSLLAEISRMNELLSDLMLMTHIELSPAQKNQYEELKNVGKH